MAPTIDGPYRQWYHPIHLNAKSEFTGSDIVWWTQSDSTDPPGEPGGGIDENSCEWTYQPRGTGDPDLVVTYQTWDNRRFGQFVFPAAFLNNGSYQITCNIVNNAGQTYQNSWTVTVNNPADMKF